MNSITFECPHCFEHNTGDESLYGQEVQCRKCKATMRIPSLPGSAGPKIARLIVEQADGDTPALAGAGPEADVVTLSPVARAYPGQLFMVLLLIGSAVGAWMGVERFSWPPWVPLIPLGLALLVFLGLWIRVKSYRYRLTTQRLFVRQGWWAREVNELELYRVKDVVVDQGIMQRLFGYGTITVVSDDETTPKVDLHGISRPLEVKEQIRTHYRAARQREGVHPTEFMQS